MRGSRTSEKSLENPTPIYKLNFIKNSEFQNFVQKPSKKFQKVQENSMKLLRLHELLQLYRVYKGPL